jgi:hypothetical protein
VGDGAPGLAYGETGEEGQKSGHTK